MQVTREMRVGRIPVTKEPFCDEGSFVERGGGSEDRRDLRTGCKRPEGALICWRRARLDG